MSVPQGTQKPAETGPASPAGAPGTTVNQVPPAEQVPAPPGGAQPAVPAQAGPAQDGPGQGAPPPHHRVRRTRIGGVWVASALFAVVLLLLLVFILENSQKVSIAFFGAHGHLPLGVALLLAAVLGVLLVAVPGTARIMQLRRTARRHRKVDVQAAQAGQAGQG